MTIEYFPKEILLEVIDNGESETGAHLVEHEILELESLIAHYRVVFEYDAKLYACEYSISVSEMTQEHPFEYEGNEIECVEVEPKEVTSIIYVEKE